MTPNGSYTGLHAARIETAVEDAHVRKILETFHREEGIEEHDT